MRGPIFRQWLVWAARDTRPDDEQQIGQPLSNELKTKGEIVASHME